MNKVLVWFHSFPDEPEVIIDGQLAEKTEVSAFRLAHENVQAKKIFSGPFNEFVEFVSQDGSYNDVKVIIPANEVLLTTASIPSKSRSRIMQALPFVLDENLIKSVDKQYFALGHISSQQCNLAVVSTYIIDFIYTQFKALSLPVSTMYSELFLLPWHEGQWSFAFLRDHVLIRTAAQGGMAVSISNIDFIFRLLLNNTLPDETQSSDIDEAESNSIQQDSTTGIPAKIVIYTEEPSELTNTISSLADEYLIETELVKSSLLKLAVPADTLTADKQREDKNTINLLQGKYHPASFKSVKIPYIKTLSAIFLLCLLSQVLFMGFQWQKKNNELQQLDSNLQALYFKTFPDSKRLIDVRSQSESNFKQLQKRTAAKNSFFSLLGIVGEEIHQFKNIKINNLRYRDGILQLDIASKTFVTNKLKAVLQKKHNIIVEERSSSRVKGEVLSVLVFKAGHI